MTATSCQGARLARRLLGGRNANDMPPHPAVAATPPGLVDACDREPMEVRPLLIIAPTPPPVHGVSMMTDHIRTALLELNLLAGHVDTRDPRPHHTIGRFDFRNVWLAFYHAWALHSSLRRKHNADVYIPISQSTLGYLRDALLIAVTAGHARRAYLHFHGADFRSFYSRSNFMVRLVIRLTLRYAHQLWLLTPLIHRTFAGLVEPDRIRTIQNVVDDPYLSAPPARAASGNRMNILYIGNMRPGKNCFDLLTALRLTRPVATSWEVHVAGVPRFDLAHRLAAEIGEIRAMGISIEALGEVDEHTKRRELEWADVFVYPTEFDGQPLVLLEAMAAGLPIIATSHGGIPDTIEHRVQGLLVAPGAIADLAAGLTWFARDPSTRIKMGDAGRARYERLYTPSRLRDDLGRILGSCSASSDGEARTTRLDSSGLEVRSLGRPETFVADPRVVSSPASTKRG